MIGLSLHPATAQLLRYQSAARCANMMRGFRGGRRLFLSVLSLLLAMVWVGQTALGVLFREPADIAKLQVWIPVGLLAYCLWHVLKMACQTPVEPFEWTDAEREMLGGSPLTRRDLVMYRLASIAMAAVAKAACFCLVMLPDLRIWPASAIGMFLALMFVDLLRMVVEIFVHGVSRQTFHKFRAAVLAIAGVGVTSALMTTLLTPATAPQGALAESLGVIWQFMAAVMDLRATPIGIVAAAPFQVFSGVILVQHLSISQLGNLLAAGLLVAIMMKIVVWLDRYFLQRRHDAERQAFRLADQTVPCDRAAQQPAHGSIRIPWRLKGVGTLAWRQLLGAYNYRVSILISLIFPAILSCVTLLTVKPSMTMIIHVIGSLVFYTFLLLPTALKFDFRRDTDRLTVLKSLPVSPAAVTIGQLAAPVVISTLFQLTVLLAVMALRPFHPGLLVTAMVVLVPVNLLIFAFENLVFLLYPYRPGQEGIVVFLRSILTFTAKGILFAVGLALTLVWALTAQRICSGYLAADSGALMPVVFATGMWLATGSIAVLTTALLIRVFGRFDPSQDTPALS